MLQFAKNYSLKNLDNEQWFEIPETNGYYLISNYTRVKSIGRYVPHAKYKSGLKFVPEKIIHQKDHTDGYLVVQFCINNVKSKHFVHRLFANVFIPNPDNKPQVNHKNGITNDNSLNNLEWNTNSENNLHAYKELNRKRPQSHLGKSGKLHHASKPVYCSTLDISFESSHLAAKALGIGQGNISHVCLNKRPQIEGLVFRYI